MWNTVVLKNNSRFFVVQEPAYGQARCPFATEIRFAKQGPNNTWPVNFGHELSHFSDFVGVISTVRSGPITGDVEPSGPGAPDRLEDLLRGARPVKNDE